MVLLNNDMLLEDGFFNSLTKHFEEPDVFGVLPATPKLYNEPLRNQKSIRFGIKLKYGLIECPIFEMNNELKQPECNFTFKLSGGTYVVDKKKFLEINGFDELFSPFYWEDVDLSYRAWKMGWKILYEPKSIAYHKDHGTINSNNFDSNLISTISERNRYILLRKNITDRAILVKHLIFIPVRLSIFLLRKNFWISLDALFKAIRFLPKIVEKRKIQKKYSLYPIRNYFINSKLLKVLKNTNINQKNRNSKSKYSP